MSNTEKSLDEKSNTFLELFDYRSSYQNVKWNTFQLFGFRAAFIFFVILIVPWHLKFYKLLFEVNWIKPHLKNLLDLVSFIPEIIPNNGLGAFSLLNLALYALVSAIGALIWTKFHGDRTEHPLLNYFLLVALRYKIGLGLIAFGVYLFFQQHLPYPSISNLHTNYGDLLAWKVYFQTTAINPEYQSFLGFVEITTGIFILYRRTVTIGSGVALGFLGNIFMVNLLYDIGNLPYITFLLLGVVYLFAQDVPRLYNLFAGKLVNGPKFYPKWEKKKLKIIRKTTLSLVGVFVILLGVSGYSMFGTSFKYPKSPGIQGTAGYYEVIEFVFDGDTIPYSLTDENRWQNVIFEEWSTISIKVNKPVLVDLRNGDTVQEEDIDRNYELAGVGGRHYYHYTVGEDKKKISLTNKNKHHPNDRWYLNIEIPSDSIILLKGSNLQKETIEAKLLRIDKRYFMYEGRRSEIEL